MPNYKNFEFRLLYYHISENRVKIKPSLSTSLSTPWIIELPRLKYLVVGIWKYKPVGKRDVDLFI